MPVPYCLDDCGFVVEPEVRQVDSSSSILLSQDCFGYSRFTISHQSEWLRSKSLQVINAGEGVEKREPSYTVGGNAN